MRPKPVVPSSDAKHGINVIEASANDSLPKDGNIKQAVQGKGWCDDKDRKVEPSYTSDVRKTSSQILNKLHISRGRHQLKCR